ncbi:MAG: hypothetical protein KIT22_18200, partial [Verrucomicrobiae bacterium]|nr:hypothetical protein [Verrucomicrobiae bacterium]
GVGATAGGIFSYLTLMKTKLILGMATGAAAVGALVWQQQRIGRLADDNVMLRQQIAALPRPAEAAPPNANLAELERLREEHAELLRLRGEVARLRQASAPAVQQSLQDAEARAAQAEAEAAAIKAEIAFRARRTQIVLAGKNLGLQARIFAQEHGQFPTSFEEMRPYLNDLINEGYLVDHFEFFPQPRQISESEAQLILFREREPHLGPPPALSKEEAAGMDDTLLNLNPGPGWARAYITADGSVHQRGSADGDFSQFEREGTAEVARP